MKLKISLVSVIAALILAGCNPGYVPDLDEYDGWCHRIDFSVTQPNLQIINGSATGNGLTSVNGLLSVLYTHTGIVEADILESQIDITVSGGGSHQILADFDVFGIAEQFQTNVNSDISTTISGQSSVAGAGGSQAQITVVTDTNTTVNIRNLAIAGNTTATNPFGADNCGDDPAENTPTPTPVEVILPTPTQTVIPTVTPTITDTPTITPTPEEIMFIYDVREICKELFNPPAGDFTSSPDGSTWQYYTEPYSITCDAPPGTVIRAAVVNQDSWHNPIPDLILGSNGLTDGSAPGSNIYYGHTCLSSQHRPWYCTDFFPELSRSNATWIGDGVPSVTIYGWSKCPVDNSNIPLDRSAQCGGFGADWGIEYLVLYGIPPTATPTPTPTATSDGGGVGFGDCYQYGFPTPTADPFITPGPGATATPVATCVPDTPTPVTVTPTATDTLTPTNTWEPDYTPSPYPTATPYPTSTAYPTYTPFPSATAGPLPTYTQQATYTPLPGDGNSGPTGTPTIDPNATPGDGDGDSGTGDGGGGSFGFGDLPGNEGMLQNVRAFFGQGMAWLELGIGIPIGLRQAWLAADPVEPPGLPDCTLALNNNNICAVYYVMEHTIFAGPGIVIIPMLTVVIDLVIFTRVLKYVKMFINWVSGVLSS
jgi:hypothetical protein